MDQILNGRQSVSPVKIARVLFASLALWLVGDGPVFAQPLCPGGTSVTELSGSFSANGVSTHPITMAPCETIVIDVSGYGDPKKGAGLKVELFGETGVRLGDSNRACYGECVFQVPVLAWSPFRGTRGPIGLASSIRVTGSSVTAPPLNYQLTITKVSRPGYNIGGLAFQDAPLLTNFPRTIYGSFYPNEVGQYFRVRLAAGGTLQATGFAEGQQNYGSSLYVYLYRPDGTEVAKIVNGSPALYGRKPFTSSVYMNFSPQPQEIYVRIFGSRFFPLLDLEMTIQAQEGPRLTLFLDDAADFNVAQPQSDHPNFLPGTDLSGTNRGMPQLVELIAAYVAADGSIVPPPYGSGGVDFWLANTTAYRGVAMNVGSDEDPDYELDPSDHQTFGPDFTARIPLWCKDYGGFTEARVTDGPAFSSLEMPVDLNRNGIPDVGWRAVELTPVSDRAALDDLDADPPGNTNYPGDGLTAVEEYRGFIVRGSHQRTNPDLKDLFTYTTHFYQLGFAVNLPVHLHNILLAEMSGTSQRFINQNYMNAATGCDPQTAERCQRALSIRNGGWQPVCRWSNGTYHSTGRTEASKRRVRNPRV